MDDKSYRLEEDKFRSMTENLAILDKLDNFTRWMYEEIKPYLFGNIFEIGSGQGTHSRSIIRDFPESKILLGDIDPNYLRILQALADERVSVGQIDISRKEDLVKINIPVNSAFALNVLEHIEDDVAALNNIYDMLEPGGRFVLLVPAHKFLYNCIDKDAGHFRRYTSQEIVGKVSRTKFKITDLHYFNFLSMFGWYVNGNILKKNVINPSAADILDRLVPLLKLFERHILRQKAGMSIIAVLQK